MSLTATLVKKIKSESTKISSNFSKYWSSLIFVVINMVRAPDRNTTALMVTMELTNMYWNICQSVAAELGTTTRMTVLSQLSPIKAPVVSHPAFILLSAEVAIR